MTPSNSVLARLQTNWVYGGALAGLLLFALTPLFAANRTQAELLVFLTLPAYMLHQFEEHDADRFRLFVNNVLFKDREALSVADVFLINIPGVWGVLAIVIWLNETVSPGWGLIGVWVILVNAVAHILQAIALRRSNPGLWTSVLFFLPLGSAGLMALWPLATSLENGASLTIAIFIHAMIIVRVRSNLARQGT
jgi:hypothetical protein